MVSVQLQCVSSNGGDSVLRSYVGCRECTLYFREIGVFGFNLF